jgi:hypothetical protein
MRARADAPREHVSLTSFSRLGPLVALMDIGRFVHIESSDGKELVRGAQRWRVMPCVRECAARQVPRNLLKSATNVQPTELAALVRGSCGSSGVRVMDVCMLTVPAASEPALV